MKSVYKLIKLNGGRIMGNIYRLFNGVWNMGVVYNRHTLITRSEPYKLGAYVPHPPKKIISYYIAGDDPAFFIAHTHVLSLLK